MPDQPRTRPLAYRTRVVLAVLFGLIVVGVVGMHLLSADHQLATSEPYAHSQLDTGAHAMHDPAAAGISEAGAGEHGCGDCGGHTMMLGSCLLVMIFGLLWVVLRPRLGRSWLVPPAGWRRMINFLTPVPHDHRIGLTHLELAISRT